MTAREADRTPTRRTSRLRGRRGRARPGRDPRPVPRRLLQFVVGLALCAAGVWTSVQAGLGVSSWDVLHVGLATQLGISYGTVIAGIGVLVLGVSWLLGVRPGLGTLVNTFSIAVVLDALLATSWLDDLDGAAVWVRVLLLVAAVLLLGFGAALYIGAGFGAGPRDSLMVACHLRGWPIGASRAVIEVAVLLVGWVLGGPVGAGTVLMAFGLGPATQVGFRVLRQQPARPGPTPAPRRPAAEPVAGPSAR